MRQRAAIPRHDGVEDLDDVDHGARPVAERVEDWSYLKFPYYKAMGWPEGVYRVAPLGRLNVADRISTPLADAEFRQFKALSQGPVEPTLYYHYARMIEVIYCIERVRELLDDPDILSTDILNTRKDYMGHGVGVIEAPRGTLTHHYWTDEKGLLTKVNLIVGTTNNYAPIQMSTKKAAQSLIKGGKVNEGLLNMVEMAFRAYDPCFGCATHSMPGRMPLEVRLHNEDGEVIDVIKQFVD